MRKQRNIVKGDLDLRCNSIKTISKVEVGGYLDLTDCESLTSLPEGLKVGDELFIGGCINLKSLPEGLKVGDNLYLGDCWSLASLPDDLEVGGWIYINNGSGIKKKNVPKNLRKKVRQY